MSARTTAEIVADLRDDENEYSATYSLPVGACNCSRCTALYHEAADRLEALEVDLASWQNIYPPNPRPAALHACDTPDCPAITYRCAETRQ